MAGIYIHIPYCKQACIYCDFHFSTVIKTKKQLLNGIRRELELRKNELTGETVETIYFGGGTPSILSGDEIKDLLESVNTHYAITAECEITLEANPDDLTTDKISDLKSSGINRLSIGIQSFFDEDLLWMNRAHNSQQAKEAISNVLFAGFENISADLIFATPLLSDEKLEQNLNTFTEFKIPHLSCYNLTIEQKTNLYHQIKNKKIKPIEDEEASRQFYYIRKYLMDRGYEHYEISNYAKPGFYSKHNTAYWQRIKYLGIGPSAHSYNGLKRSWNIRNNENYIRSLINDELPTESEILSHDNIFNEFVLTGLRTQWGLNLASLKDEFAEQYFVVKPLLDKFIHDKKLNLNDEIIRLTPEYLVMADSIASELFII